MDEKVNSFTASALICGRSRMRIKDPDLIAIIYGLLLRPPFASRLNCSAIIRQDSRTAPVPLLASCRASSAKRRYCFACSAGGRSDASSMDYAPPVEKTEGENLVRIHLRFTNYMGPLAAGAALSQRFEEVYRKLGRTKTILAAAAHHRFA
jgi:hypothetical protein